MEAEGSAKLAQSVFVLPWEGGAMHSWPTIRAKAGL